MIHITRVEIKTNAHKQRCPCAHALQRLQSFYSSQNACDSRNHRVLLTPSIHVEVRHNIILKFTLKQYSYASCVLAHDSAHFPEDTRRFASNAHKCSHPFSHAFMHRMTHTYTRATLNTKTPMINACMQVRPHTWWHTFPQARQVPRPVAAHGCGNMDGGWGSPQCHQALPTMRHISLDHARGSVEWGAKARPS
jgi:hypothetical protein